MTRSIYAVAIDAALVPIPFRRSSCRAQLGLEKSDASAVRLWRSMAGFGLEAFMRRT